MKESTEPKPNDVVYWTHEALRESLVRDLVKVARELTLGIESDKILFTQIEAELKTPTDVALLPALCKEIDRIEDELGKLSIRLSMDLDVAFTGLIIDAALGPHEAGLRLTIRENGREAILLVKTKRLCARRQLAIRETCERLHLAKTATVSYFHESAREQIGDACFIALQQFHKKED